MKTFKTSLLAASLALFAPIASSCVEYDAPPEHRLVQPEGGSFIAGQPVELRFSEPVKADTLRFNVWPDVRDIENEIPNDASPLVADCNSACDDLVVELAEDRTSASLTFNPDTLGRPGVPLLLEVMPGLSDAEGNDTGVSDLIAIKFRPPDERFNEEPVEFQDGVYILVAQVTQPLPATLTLVSDVQVAESGEFRLAGAEGDAIGDAPKNTSDPTKIVVDETPGGWAAHATGFVKLQDGKRFLRSDTFTVELPLVGLIVRLSGVRLDAEITTSDETGNDKIEGTLSYEKLELVNGDRKNEYEGGNTALVAEWVPPELAPTGHPLVCGDLCGIVAGVCDPPESFPGEGFCAVE